MANIILDPLTSAVGATLAGTSVAVQGATWVASEFAKVGKKLAGRPGEITAALLGASTGAMGGFLVGSILGAISRGNVVNYFLSGAIAGSTDPSQGDASAESIWRGVIRDESLTDRWF